MLFRHTELHQGFLAGPHPHPGDQRSAHSPRRGSDPGDEGVLHPLGYPNRCFQPHKTQPFSQPYDGIARVRYHVGEGEGGLDSWKP